jgi:hypothetical protein
MLWKAKHTLLMARKARAEHRMIVWTRRYTRLKAKLTRMEARAGHVPIPDAPHPQSWRGQR